MTDTASVAQVPAKARTSRWRTGLRRLMKRKLVVGGGGALLAATLVAGTAAASVTRFEFEMVPSAATCQPDASGHVTVLSLGPGELMDVDVSGLPPKTDFDLFVIQVPHGPFGVSWYQGDIETNGAGNCARPDSSSSLPGSGASEAPKVTVLALICLMPPPEPIDW